MAEGMHPAGASGPSRKEDTGGALTVYFANWYTAEDSRVPVGSLPWDRLDGISHAFFKIVPKPGGYAVASTDPEADLDEGNPEAHFAQYAKCAGKHPGTEVLLSIGGWTACGRFSEMALTKEGRTSFIRSCMDILLAYPFLSGLDIDWEFPGCARGGGDGDEGNPVRGDDRTNYTRLLAELRGALDGTFGAGNRRLTVCACASVRILSEQDYASLHPYVDRINLMTYDLAGPWDSRTGHHAALYGGMSADTAVGYLRSCGVPERRIAIGCPLYGYGWRLPEPCENPVGRPAQSLPGSVPWHRLRQIEAAAVPMGIPGWHAGFDEQAKAAFLWNDDPSSPDYLVYYSYESVRSLEERIRYIRDMGLGGLIVWEAHGDGVRDGWPMLSRLSAGLHPGR